MQLGADADGHEQVDADGRGDLTDGEVHRGEHTEVDQIDPELLGNGIHNGDKDVHGGVRIHEAAGDEEDHVDDQQEHILVAGDLEQQALRRAGNAVDRADVGKQRRRADDQHDTAGGLAGVHEQLAHVLPLDLSVNDHADEQAVDNGDRSSLGRGEETAVDTAEDDDGNQEAPERSAEGLPAVTPARLFTRGLNALSANLDHDDGDQRKAHHNAGENAAHEHIADGNAGDRGVNDEGNGRRDHDGDRGGRRHQGRGKRGGEAAAVDHRGDQDDAERRDGRGAGAGDGAEEAGHDDADDGDAAADMTDAVIDKVDQSCGDAGLCHDVAGEDKERDRQQQELCHAVVDVGGDDGKAVAGKKHCENRRGAEADCNGNVEQQHHKEASEQNQINHSFIPPFLSHSPPDLASHR